MPSIRSQNLKNRLATIHGTTPSNKQSPVRTHKDIEDDDPEMTALSREVLKMERELNSMQKGH